MEDELIQISGLIEGLQQALTDDNAPTCIANAIEHRLACLQERSYEHWWALSNKGSPGGPGPHGTEESAICMRREMPKKRVK